MLQASDFIFLVASLSPLWDTFELWDALLYRVARSSFVVSETLKFMGAVALGWIWVLYYGLLIGFLLIWLELICEVYTRFT